MLFSTVEYILFFPTVFILYWFVFNKSLRVQNFLIFISSYVFYGWWDWRFLSLLLLTSTVDYIMGIKIEDADNKSTKKKLVAVSWTLNLVIFGYFKYFGFFVNSFVDAFHAVGIDVYRPTLNIILPIGISFYTLQSLSYTIDIYRNQLKPTRNFVDFLAFVSFFPQLLAGPIERATNLLPQFYKKRVFDFEISKDGMRQILWGLFKKVVIADNCAPFVSDIFVNYSHLSGTTLYFGYILFSIQLYCDFSGYSDIAVGSGKLFGFRLMRNFQNPFFALNPPDFWRRWHISLSSWFRDYLYVPMGGSKKGKLHLMLALIVTFTISGLWHGANWNFVLWGFINGCFIAFFFLVLGKNRKIKFGDTHKIPTIREFRMILVNYNLIAFTLVFFRSPDVTTSFSYYHQMFTHAFGPIQWGKISFIFIGILFMVFEWLNRHKMHALENLKYGTFGRWLIYFVLSCFVVIEMGKPAQEFIYFQF
jgi:alginate O-acetyltransferase complex protein AlgI